MQNQLIKSPAVWIVLYDTWLFEWVAFRFILIADWSIPSQVCWRSLIGPRLDLTVYLSMMYEYCYGLVVEKSTVLALRKALKRISQPFLEPMKIKTSLVKWWPCILAVCQQILKVDSAHNVFIKCENVPFLCIYKLCGIHAY